LGDDAGLWWSSPAIEPIIHEAIRAWIKSSGAAKPPPQPAAKETGYQWKQLFLPEGTKLRAYSGGKPYFAVVAETEIRHEELPTSPSGFANLHGSGNRNAWKAIWLRFPGSERWVLADNCRTLQKAETARMFGESTP
jgi:hypothetical protein